MANNLRKWRKATFIHIDKRLHTLRELDEAKQTIVTLKSNVSELQTEHMMFGMLFVILWTMFLWLAFV
jgi:hypothetical protein